MTGFAGADALLVFLKEPVPGRVKSRLASSIGSELAAFVSRALAGHALRSTAPEGDQYARRVLFDPPDARDRIAQWLPGLELRAQANGDLGRRMSSAIADAFADGARRTAVVGTDVPALRHTDVTDAFESLDEHDVAIGPATDGGYYLIALKRPQPELFEGIGWSGPEVLAHTLDRASRRDLSVRVLRTIGDVDTVEDLAAEWARIRPLLDEETRAALERTLRPT